VRSKFKGRADASHEWRARVRLPLTERYEEENETMGSVQEFFDGLAARVPADRIAGMSNTYVFDIEGAGAWTVAIADGALTVTEGAGEGDVTISASEESFEKIVAGEQNPTTAYMTGKLKIKGDMGAAMKLQKLF
jgi:putative sterol carrier protein